MVEGDGETSEPNLSPSSKSAAEGGGRPSKYASNFQRDLMAGAVMGGIVHTIVAPIERSKLLLQTQESNLAIVKGSHRRFRGMFDCIVRTVRDEGFFSLWRGNGSSVLRYYPSVALNFSLKRWHVHQRNHIVEKFPGFHIVVDQYDSSCKWPQHDF